MISHIERNKSCSPRSAPPAPAAASPGTGRSRCGVITSTQAPLKSKQFLGDFPGIEESRSTLPNFITKATSRNRNFQNWKVDGAVELGGNFLSAHIKIE